MERFRIKKYEYCDEYGKRINAFFYVSECKKFLGFSYWRDIKHDEYGYGDFRSVLTKFETIEQAQDFINNILCPNKGRDGRKVTIVDRVNCK